MAYIGNDVDAIFIPGSVNTSTNLTITGGGLTQTGGDVNFDSGTLFIDEDLNRVGIGITTPEENLHIKGSNYTTLLMEANTEPSIYLRQPTSDTTGYSAALYNSYGNTGIVNYSRTPSVTNYVINYSPSSKYTQLQAGGWDVVKIWGTSLNNRSVVIGDGQGGALNVTGTVNQPLQVKGGAYVSGNVGIGTTNPGNTLHLGGAAGVGQRWENYTSGNNAYITFESGDNFQFNVGGPNAYYTMWSGGSEKIRVTHLGNVGIGTTNPASELHVRHNDNNTAEITIEGGGTGNAGLRLIPGGQTNEYYVYVDTNRNFRIQDYTSERFRINSSGNVGIGSETPGKKLDVAGTIRSNTSSASLELVSSNAGSSSISFLNGVTYEGYIQSVGSGGGLIFATGPSATERVRIDSSGNLCVGRNSSYTRLTVSNGGSTRSGITISDGDTASLMLFAGGAQPAVISTDAIHQSLIFKRGSNVGTENGVETMRINGSGNVGIGTTNPTAKLLIDGGGVNSIAFRDDSIENHKFDSDSGAIVVNYLGFNAGTGRFRDFIVYNGRQGLISMFDGSSGNVGIGTANPGHKLSIYGTANSNEVRSSDGTVTSQWYQDNGGLAIFGTVSNHPQVFRTNGTEKLRITTGGRVGIGTSNPLSILDMRTTGLDIVGGNAINGQSMSGITVTDTQNTNASIGLWFGIGESHWSGISGQRSNYASTWGTDLRFYTHEDATTDLTYTRERLRITSSGNVGIGTTNPTAKLHVQDGGFRVNSSGQDGVISRPTNDGFPFALLFEKSRAGTALTSGDGIGAIYFNAFDGSEFRFTAGINATVSGPVSTNNVPTHLSFFTGSTSFSGEKLRISSAGNVGIGTMNPTQKLHVIGNVSVSAYVQAANAVMGTTSDVNFGVFGSNSITRGILITRDGDVNGSDMFINTSGLVGLGTTNPLDRLHLASGKVRCGPQSTNGGMFLAQNYSGDNLICNLSSNFSSGSLLMGWGVAGMSGQGSSGQVVSTFSNFSSQRAVLRIDNNGLSFLSTHEATSAAVGTEIGVYGKFSVFGTGTTLNAAFHKRPRTTNSLLEIRDNPLIPGSAEYDHAGHFFMSSFTRNESDITVPILTLSQPNGNSGTAVYLEIVVMSAVGLQGGVIEGFAYRNRVNSGAFSGSVSTSIKSQVGGLGAGTLSWSADFTTLNYTTSSSAYVRYSIRVHLVSHDGAIPTMAR